MNNDNVKSTYLTGIQVVGGTAIVLSVISSPFLIIPMIKKFGHIPWMTTPKSVITTAFKYLADKKNIVRNHQNRTISKKLKMVDLGSGDGRICIEAAKWGYHAVGYELNPFLYVLASYNAYREGVYNNVEFG